MKNISKILLLIIISVFLITTYLDVKGEIYSTVSNGVIRKTDPNLNGKWIGNAIVYSCYRKGQAPGVASPTEKEIYEDLVILSKYWNLIRVFSSDNDTENILKIIKNKNLPLKIMLGVWLEDERGNFIKKYSNIKQVVNSIRFANEYKDIVFGISVGNETQVFWSQNKMPIVDLIDYIRIIRNNTSVPVTTAEDYNYLITEQSKLLDDEVDFILVYIHPLWNGVKLENSIKWIDEIVCKVQEMHPNKEVIIGETGWATNYEPGRIGYGKEGTTVHTVVNVEAQQKFLSELYKWIEQKKVVTFWFEAFDESWKDGGNKTSPYVMEKNWGLFYENRIPKESLINFFKNIK